MNKRWNRLAGAMLCLLAVLLSACGGGGGSTSSASTNTAPAAQAAAVAAPVISLSASPTATTVGQLITLTWSVSNPTSSTCNASGAWNGTLATSGTQSVSASSAGTLTYTLNCSGVSNSASVTVTTPPPAPTVSLALAPASITTAQSSTLTWSSTNATNCSASGAWSGSKATSGSVTLSPASAGSFNYSLSCSGTGGTAEASGTLTVSTALSNSTTLVVDNGPSGVNASINTPFVSVTVCRPGTSVCQTIDHVLVDTGSYGLRLLAAPLSSTLALPVVKTPSGADAAECGQFISGYTWGAVRQADVKIADEKASAISIEVIGDSGSSYSIVPTACSSVGNNIGSLSALGAKGILGIGLFKQDCGDSCVRSTAPGAYYGCTAGVCTPSLMPLAQQVSNPVASFAVNNNGVLLVLPAVSTSGATSVTGSLIFGVGTQSNNAIASEKVYQANSSGNFSTTYKGRVYSASFIDSGSNGYFFSDASLRSCTGSSGFYCPGSSTTLSAVNSAYDGSASGTVSFSIVNADSLSSSINAAPVGGTLGGRSGSNAFDWGLPFFYGRRVFVVMDGASSPQGAGPYWAY